MIRTPITFPGNAPLTRALAAEVVQTASNFEARVMIQREQKIVNAKSMLGLLSLGTDDQANMVLIAEGVDESAAVAAVVAVLAYGTETGAAWCGLFGLPTGAPFPANGERGASFSIKKQSFFAVCGASFA